MKQLIFKKTDLEINEAYRKIMYWFFAFPQREISLNDIVKLAKISKTTANKVISRMAKENFLKIQKLGKVWRISCNQQHEFNTERKIPYNLELVYESGIIEKILKDIQGVRCIVLFGSYRKGDDIESSDLDIAVETLDGEEMKIINLGVIQRLGYRQNIAVNIVKFSRKKIDNNLFANIANGIVLHGFLEVKT